MLENIKLWWKGLDIKGFFEWLLIMTIIGLISSIATIIIMYPICKYIFKLD